MVRLLLALLQVVLSDFVNEEVERVVDLSSRFAQITTTIQLYNEGPKELSKYYYSLPISDFQRLAHVSAFLIDSPYNNLDVEPSSESNGLVQFKVKMLRGVPNQGKVTLVLSEVFAEKMYPYPKKIGIYVISNQDLQYLWFEDHKHFISNYITKKEEIRVVLPNEDIQSFTKDSTSNQQGSEITFGPYYDVPPNQDETMYVHFQHSVALPYFQSVERRIEVSHWGNIAIDEYYSVTNRAALLDGEFSRVDFTNRYQASAINALEYMEAVLPRSSWGLYFRDELGNVSTSHARKHPSYAYLEIEPRFPILGGWKSNFQIGYNLPSRYFLKYKNDLHMLNVTFGFPFRQIIAEKLQVKVILPEGAYDISSNLPFKIDKEYNSTIFSYLDLYGRPVLIMEKDNAVDFHRKPFQVIYKHSASLLIIEPLYLSFLVFVALLCQIGFFRYDIRLDSKAKKD